MTLIKQFCLVLVFAGLSSTVSAQTMFKCTQANGRIAYQAEPCPDSANEQVLKANKRGEVKVVQPTTRNASAENVDATPPTGARSRDDSTVSHAVADPDPVAATSVGAGTDSAASPQASSPNSSPKGYTGIFDLVIMLIALLFLAISAFASIWLIVIAFSESVVWGLLCIFIPLCYLIFVATHWDKAKKPFLISLSAALAPIFWLGIYDRAHGHHANVSKLDIGKPGIYLAIDLAPLRYTFA